MLVRDLSRAVGPGLSFGGNSLPMAIIIRTGSKPRVRCRSVERTSDFDGGETRLFELPRAGHETRKTDNRYDCGEPRSQVEGHLTYR